MEIAHAPYGFLRVIGKLVLLGLLVILLIKVILPLLVLAAIGLVTCFTARALYTRRHSLKRILFRTKESLVHSITTISHTGTVAIEVASWAFRMPLRMIKFGRTIVNTGIGRLCALLAEMLRASLVIVGTLIGRAARIGCVTSWTIAWKSQKVLTSAVALTAWHGAHFAAAGVRCSVRGCVSVSRMTGTALVEIRNQSSVICGTLVEATSGALIGAMIGFSPSFLPQEYSIAARVCGAALFGAFLGITVGLSRSTWANEGEAGHRLENQN